MIIKKNNTFKIKKTCNNYKINWNIFDKIYCIHYSLFNDRFESCKLILDNIGILSNKNFEFFYTNANNYYKFLLLDDNKNIDFSCIHLKNINLQLNRFNLLKIIQHFKYKRVLILEDDICFLKDTKLIKEYLNNFPLDYDIVNMDPWFYDNINYKNILLNNKINNYYCKINFDEMYNASFISLSNNAIDFLIKNIEYKFRPMDNYVFHRKDTIDDNLKIAISNKNLCIQKDFKIRQDWLLNNKYTKQCNYSEYE